MNVVVLRVPYWGLGNLERRNTLHRIHYMGGRWSLLVSSTKRNKTKDETKQNKTQKNKNKRGENKHKKGAFKKKQKKVKKRLEK